MLMTAILWPWQELLSSQVHCFEKMSRIRSSYSCLPCAAAVPRAHLLKIYSLVTFVAGSWDAVLMDSHVTSVPHQRRFGNTRYPMIYMDKVSPSWRPDTLMNYMEPLRVLVTAEKVESRKARGLAMRYIYANGVTCPPMQWDFTGHAVRPDVETIFIEYPIVMFKSELPKKRKKMNKTMWFLYRYVYGLWVESMHMHVSLFDKYDASRISWRKESHRMNTRTSTCIVRAKINLYCHNPSRVGS